MASSLVRLEDLVVVALLVHDLGLGEAPRLAGRYRLVGIRGRGARGLVCRAVDERLEREVAIKLYADADTAREGEVDTEARALARLDHPNVVRVYDVGRDSLVLGETELEISYLVMELVDGTSMRTYLGSAERNDASTRRILKEVATALEAAHERGLAHRDMKPENVMIDATGRARVVDFGLSRYSNPDPDATIVDEAMEPFATASGRLVGTVAYMAPEARTGRADARSDQFSFAMMAWEALTGVLPFDGHRGHWRPDEVSRFEGHETIEASLRAVLERALSIDPEARHPSIAPLREAFMPVRARSGRKLFLGVFVAIVALTVVAVVGALRENRVRESNDAALDAELGTDASISDVQALLVEDAGAPPDCSLAAGRWELDAIVVRSKLRAVAAGTRSYFVVEVVPLSGCDALLRLTKVGDEASSSSSDAGPFFLEEDIRDDETRVRLLPVDGGVLLEPQRFGLASSRRTRREYDFSLRFNKRRVVGDLAYLSVAGNVAYRAEVRGARRRSTAPFTASPASLPCGSRCRLSCAEDREIVSNCVEACESNDRLPSECEFDAGLSRSDPLPERSE